MQNFFFMVPAWEKEVDANTLFTCSNINLLFASLLHPIAVDTTLLMGPVSIDYGINLSEFMDS